MNYVEKAIERDLTWVTFDCARDEATNSALLQIIYWKRPSWEGELIGEILLPEMSCEEAMREIVTVEHMEKVINLLRERYRDIYEQVRALAEKYLGNR